MKTYTFTDEEQRVLDSILDDQRRVARWPARRKRQLFVLKYLADKFEPGRQYDEREVNALLQRWHTFNDVALLRRDLVDAKLLTRHRDGSQYQRCRG